MSGVFKFKNVMSQFQRTSVNLYFPSFIFLRGWVGKEVGFREESSFDSILIGIAAVCLSPTLGVIAPRAGSVAGPNQSTCTPGRVPRAMSSCWR